MDQREKYFAALQDQMIRAACDDEKWAAFYFSLTLDEHIGLAIDALRRAHLAGKGAGRGSVPLAPVH